MGLLNKALTIGAASAAVYGIRKGMQNGTLQQLPEKISSAVTNMQSQTQVQPTNAIQSIAEQEAKNNNAHFQAW
ncbi:hypothetical protein [Paraliobacillus sediminis]|uniref:hypothetical protein n=1 Tax=Paraliobacillus sediminis TaxID=1885916 RepID=UPI000E3C6459|nr:hypothetical protein [Paraliobacillus sediminis]